MPMACIRTLDTLPIVHAYLFSFVDPQHELFYLFVVSRD